MSKATSTVKALLKTVYDDADVNAAQVWKGYEPCTGRTGWHIQWFGTQGAEYIGGSVSEVEDFVNEVADGREA